jgi:predicted phage terminase large subunit-like protein
MIQRETNIPILPIGRTKDKLTRVEEVTPYIESGKVLLPYSSTFGQNPVILSECEGFSRDDSHSHDDIIDTIVDAINIFKIGYTIRDLL